MTYSYEYCKAILLNSDAHITGLAIDENSLLDDKAKLLIRKMARVSNSARHSASRDAAMLMYQKINMVDVSSILEALLGEIAVNVGFDWVELVATQLPIRVILTGLRFNDDDCAYIAANIAVLTRIVLPDKTNEDIEIINPVVDRIYDAAERHVVSNSIAAAQEAIELIICNLVGLFIQCYDAGRGLLCNILLGLVSYGNLPDINKIDNTFYKKLVNETLRWDPPVHNTRRIAVKDFCLDGQTIKGGESIMVVLAAANLDPAVFEHPDKFDLTRINNDQHLTFGLGGHNCLAKYLCIDMATGTCSFLMNKFQHITILQKDFSYEPQLNVRLIKELMINLS